METKNQLPLKGHKIILADRITLVGMLLCVALMLQPWWSEGLRVGFFLLMGCIIGQIIFSHLLPEEPR